MIEDRQLSQLKTALKRIFAMPISRSTFREIQNAIVAVTPDTQDDSNALFEAIISGQAEPAIKYCVTKEVLEDIIDEFTINVRVAKDVFERGEFISLASADIITQPNRIAFLNRIRRVDGEELQFLTDIRGTINLLHHWIGRLNELEKNELGKEQVRKHKEDFNAVKERLNQLITQLDS